MPYLILVSILICFLAHALAESPGDANNCSLKSLSRINFQKLSSLDRRDTDQKFSSCIMNSGSKEMADKTTNIYNQKSLAFAERQEQEELALLDYYTHLENKKCDDDIYNKQGFGFLKTNYSGLNDYRNNSPTKRYEQLYNATGLLFGYSNGNKNVGQRLTSFVCENERLLCASFHNVCDNKSPKPRHHEMMYINNWAERKQKHIFIDITRSWLGKNDKDGNPIYGVCPTNVDNAIPVLLRLKEPATSKYPHIKPVRLKFLDLNKLKIKEGMSSSEEIDILEYYNKLNQGSVAVGYHRERDIDIPNHLKKKRGVKYVQENGVKLVPEVPSDRKGITWKVKWDTRLLTTGYFTKESSGSPVGQCDKSGNCEVFGITAGAYAQCWEYGQITEHDRDCFNVTQAFDHKFKQVVDDQVRRINLRR